MTHMKLSNETLTLADLARMTAVGLTLLGLVYYAGYQSRRLDTLEYNQRNVMAKLDELVRTDSEMRVEVEKLKSIIDGRGKTTFSLMKGDS